LNLLNQFLVIFWALWHPFFTVIIFLDFSSEYIFDFFAFSSFLCGDPKMGYNNHYEFLFYLFVSFNAFGALFDLFQIISYDMI